MNIDLTVDDLHSFDHLDAFSRAKMQELKELGKDRAKGHGGVKLDDLKTVAVALGISKSQKKETLVVRHDFCKKREQFKNPNLKRMKTHVLGC